MKIKKIKPLFTSIVTTMDTYDSDSITSEGIIDVSKQEGGIKEYQKVLAVGSAVRDISVGDIVSINPTRFAVKEHKAGTLKDGIIKDNPVIKYNFDILEIDGSYCLFLQDRDINFIIEDYEDTVVTQ